MYGRFPTCVSLSLCAVLLAVAACERGTGPTSPSPAAKALLTAEPRVATPEFLASSACPALPPFGVRVTVLVGGADLIVRGIRFGFADRFGNSTVPDVLFLPASAPAALPSGPVGVPTPGFTTIPNSSPIPIPGAPPINGVLVSERASLSLPFFLRFPCGVFPEGTIVVTGDITDRHGQPQSPKMQLEVKRAIANP